MPAGSFRAVDRNCLAAVADMQVVLTNFAFHPEILQLVADR